MENTNRSLKIQSRITKAREALSCTVSEYFAQLSGEDSYFQSSAVYPTQTIISVILCAGITQHHIPATKFCETVAEILS